MENQNSVLWKQFVSWINDLNSITEKNDVPIIELQNVCSMQRSLSRLGAQSVEFVAFFDKVKPSSDK